MSTTLFDFIDDPLFSPDAHGKITAAAPGGASRRKGSRRYTRLNRRLAVFIGAVVFFSPVPVALNRPSLWLLWVGIVAIAAFLYFSMTYLADRKRPVLSLRHPWLFGLALVVPVFALVQTLPLGAWLGLSLPWPIDVNPALIAAPQTISLVPDASYAAAIRFSGYILFAVLVIETAGRADRALTLGWAVFWGVVAHAIWAVVALRLLDDMALLREKTSYLGSATGMFINRNSFATFLGMGGVLGLALIFDRANRARMRRARPAGPLSPERIEALACWMGLALIYLALVLTQSRLGIAASVLGAMVCFFIMRVKAGGQTWFAFAAVFGVGAILLVGALMVVGEGVLERAVFFENNFAHRWIGYVQSFSLIEARTWLGFGMDSFRPAYEMVHELPKNPARYWDRAHSTYVTHWVELGVIVGSIPIVLGLFVVWRLIDVIRRRTLDYALSVAALSALIVGATHSTLDFSLEMPANVILLLSIIGLGITYRARPDMLEATAPTPAPKAKRRKKRNRRRSGKSGQSA